jgi:hypothetical protein
VSSDYEQRWWDWYNQLPLHHPARIARGDAAIKTALKKLAREKEIEAERRLAFEQVRQAREASMLGGEKQRRSRVDWLALTGDASVAVRQMAYERCTTAFRMRQAGMSLLEIGRHFGVSRERARQLAWRGEAWQAPRLSPVEWWMKEEAAPMREMGPGTKTRMSALLETFSRSTPRDWLLVASAHG